MYKTIFILLCSLIMLNSCFSHNFGNEKEYQTPPIVQPIDFSKGEQKFNIYINTSENAKWSIGLYLYAKPIGKLPFFKYPTPNKNEYQNFNRILGIKSMENNGFPAEITVQILDPATSKVILNYSTRYPTTNAYYKGRVTEMIIDIPRGKNVIVFQYSPISTDLSSLYGEVFIREPYNGK